jgi:hypothetical protein
MRLMMKLLVCLCLVPVAASGQERIRKFMVGPKDDQVRVVIAFAEPSEEGYKLQSMIIDLTPVKDKKEQPAAVHVDLTSTVRSLATGAKKQKILILRWNKAGELELKCAGQWKKQEAVASIEKIVTTTKAVIGAVPLDAKAPTEVTLPKDLEQKISSILDSLFTEDLPCLRDGQ